MLVPNLAPVFKTFIVSGGGNAFIRPVTQSAYGIPPEQVVGSSVVLEFMTAGDGKRLGLFVLHTNADREYAYDRKSHIGKLDKALDVGQANGWAIVNMRKDWKQIFPPKK